MKLLIFTSLLLVAVSAFLSDEHGAEFQDFKVKFNKIYRNQTEETKRFVIFRDNIRSIKEHNALYEQGLVSYKKGINKFTDLTKEEFKALLTLGASKKPNFNATKYVKSGLAIPDSVDWRTQGQVTEVKDQGNCGSCWAFSITGSVEAAYFRKSGKLVSLSVQQLVDCSTDINFGCGGGYIDKTYPYVEKYGLEPEADYSYTGTDDACKYSASKVVTKIFDYTAITSGDEDAVLDAVANIGPISVDLDATELSSYTSGIYKHTRCFKDGRNHAVLIVGYGIENGEKFWIVKNSFGEDWGEQGYFRIVRGTDECGIVEDPTIPNIK